MSGLKLTTEMEDAIHAVAKRMKVSPESVLKHMVFSYAAKFGGQDALGKPDYTNVVSFSKD